MAIQLATRINIGEAIMPLRKKYTGGREDGCMDES